MIKVDISKCTGCKKCETVCAFVRSGKVSNRLARMKVSNLYEIGVDAPVACVQCEERYCLRCPEDAISVGPYGQIIVSQTRCTLCGVCEKACPIGAIEIFNDIVYVCDLCGGRPQCVDACTEGAIISKLEEKEGPSLEALQEETRKMNPSQKRNHYIKKLSSGVRKDWRRQNA